MAKKDAGKENVKVKKPKQGPPQDSVKPKKPKKEAAPAEAPVIEEKKPEAPRPPADPRLKYVKKFHGRFLPRGPLRDRHTALFARWNSGEDHGGVTVEELKSLYEDWRATRQKPVKKTAAV
ncbi:hypothetical protein [Planctomyces sp. SH-PL62]|uniref:hypothetical protein n=1 Tax=Planctomyces sp. SH-PL62 TaxID=1636152 RepID=UPI00078D67F5|nr:hypothetical protein [Planctomyces sp. SH-PL62]AMV39759.1 hypothetical protein VT85_20165 [Planctomyces sp. SH-PL62]